MYEYELYSTIQSLELFKQSLESYLIELSNRHLKILNNNEHEDDDIRDSVSETSSFIESTNLPKEYLQSRLSTSSDERKTLTSSSSSNHSNSKKDYQLTLI